jgi:hypothetical protein
MLRSLTLLLALLVTPHAFANCIRGDCESGVGTWRASDGSEFTAKFVSRKPQGYAIWTLPSFQEGGLCEGEVAGFKWRKNGTFRCILKDPFADLFRSGTSGAVIADNGQITMSGTYNGMSLKENHRVDVDKLISDLKRLRSRADGQILRWMPASLDFLPSNSNSLRKEYSAQYRSGSRQSEPPSFTSRYCVEGDCHGGFGIIDRADEKVVSKFIGGRSFGHSLLIKPDGKSCEHFTVGGKVSGIQRCILQTKTSERIGYITVVNGEKNGPYMVTAFDGKIIMHGNLVGSDFTEEDIDHKSLWRGALEIRAQSDPWVMKHLPKKLKEIPEPWFPNERRPSLTSNLTPKTKPVKSANSCIEGDCINGVGVTSGPKGRLVSKFVDGKARGYQLFLDEDGGGCEGYTIRDKFVGVSRCSVTTDSAQGIGYATYKSGKKNGPYIIVDNDGQVILHGILVGSDFKEGDVDHKALWKRAIRNRNSADVRILEKLPPALKEIPEPRFSNHRSTTKNDRIVSTSKVGRTKPDVKPKPVRKTPLTRVCIDGNCQNGFGTLRIGEKEYTGQFYDGEVSGYALITEDGNYCEARMAVGKNAGMSHCYSIDLKAHVIGNIIGDQAKGGQIFISDKGEITAYNVYVDGEIQRNYFASESDKNRLMKKDLRSYLSQFGQIRGGRPEGIQDWMPRELKTIPKHEIPRVSRAPSRTERLKQERAGNRPQSSSSSRSTATYESKPLPERPKSQSDLQRLSLVAADLNGNRRQVNPDYRLDRVRIDPSAFELRYEFTSSKDVASLNQTLLKVSGETAYCRASKLEIFRKEKMPARWIYIDNGGKTFEFVTKSEDC